MRYLPKLVMIGDPLMENSSAFRQSGRNGGLKFDV